MNSYRQWDLRIDKQGRICLPASLCREFSLEGRKVVLRKRGRVLELMFQPAKPAKRIVGTIPLAGITAEAAERLHRQGVAVEADGDKKIAVLKQDWTK